jgi:hypothetical protein
MKKTTLAMASLTFIFGLCSVSGEAPAGDRTPDESINYGVSTKRIDSDFRLWLEGRLVKDYIDKEQVTNIGTYNAYNSPGTGESVAIGQVTDISGCNGDANCEVMGSYTDSTVSAETNEYAPSP